MPTLKTHTNVLLHQRTKDQTKEKLTASFSCNNMDTVKQRIANLEAGQYVTAEVYERSMDDFFAKELGLVR